MTQPDKLIGEWVFGEWEILPEDRVAQARKEPYWTLIDRRDYGSMVLTRGPFGRKAMEPESTIWASGWDTDGIGCSEDDQKMILAALNSYKDSVKCATCGKPMEDKGAAKQWCSDECYRKRSKTPDPKAQE